MVVLLLIIVFNPHHVISGEMSFEGCSLDKGCFRNGPRGCTPQTCDITAIYSVDEQTMTMDLSAEADGWVAVGFSKDKQMVRLIG